MEKVVPLPESTPTVPDTTPKHAQSSSSGAGGGSGGEQKKIPKYVSDLRTAVGHADGAFSRWLQKGLMKRK